MPEQRPGQKTRPEPTGAKLLTGLTDTGTDGNQRDRDAPPGPPAGPDHPIDVARQRLQVCRALRAPLYRASALAAGVVQRRVVAVGAPATASGVVNPLPLSPALREAGRSGAAPAKVSSTRSASCRAGRPATPDLTARVHRRHGPPGWPGAAAPRLRWPETGGRSGSRA